MQEKYHMSDMLGMLSIWPWHEKVPYIWDFVSNCGLSGTKLLTISCELVFVHNARKVVCPVCLGQDGINQCDMKKYCTYWICQLWVVSFLKNIMYMGPF